MSKTIHIVLGKTIEEWNNEFGQNEDLWSFPYIELLDGTIEPNPDIWYWAIGDRLYETSHETN